jgi:hypothetical protein
MVAVDARMTVKRGPNPPPSTNYARARRFGDYIKTGLPCRRHASGRLALHNSGMCGVTYASSGKYPETEPVTTPATCPTIRKARQEERWLLEPTVKSRR